MSSTRPNLHAFFTRSRTAPAAPPPPAAPEAPRRKPPVVATRLTAAAPLRREPTAETCACGHSYEHDRTVWSELVGRRVVAYCPGCAPSARPGERPGVVR